MHLFLSLLLNIKLSSKGKKDKSAVLDNATWCIEWENFEKEHREQNQDYKYNIQKAQYI